MSVFFSSCRLHDTTEFMPVPRFVARVYWKGAESHNIFQHKVSIKPNHPLLDVSIKPNNHPLLDVSPVTSRLFQGRENPVTRTDSVSISQPSATTLWPELPTEGWHNPVDT